MQNRWEKRYESLNVLEIASVNGPKVMNHPHFPGFQYDFSKGQEMVIVKTQVEPKTYVIARLLLNICMGVVQESLGIIKSSLQPKFTLWFISIEQCWEISGYWPRDLYLDGELGESFLRIEHDSDILRDHYKKLPKSYISIFFYYDEAKMQTHIQTHAQHTF